MTTTRGPLQPSPLLQQDILRVLLYFDIFEHPLRAEEIYRFLPSDSTDLPPKKGSSIKLGILIFWIKGGSNEQTKAYGRRDHQQAARSRGLAGQGDVDGRSDASARGERCNVLSRSDGFATSGGKSMVGCGLIRPNG